MNTKLFDIRTTVRAEFEGDHLVEVVITTTKKTRSRIWDIVTNDHFNPSVARYEGGVPTKIILTPYPGYEGSNLVAQMAEAAACLALVEDFTVLFGKNVFDVLDDNIAPWPKNFAIDSEIIAEFQRLYIRWRAMNTLRSRLHELKFEGLNTSAIYAWHDEAVECLRRLYGEPRNYETEEVVDQVGDYAKQARAIDALKMANWHFLEAQVDSFEMAINANSQGLELPIPAMYAKIVEKIEGEAARLQAEVDSFRPIFDKIQSELMVAIRKATPPAPPALKRK